MISETKESISWPRVFLAADAEMQEMRPSTGKGNAKESNLKFVIKHGVDKSAQESNEVRSMTLFLGVAELRNG